MSDDLETEIRTNAEGPLQVSGDAGSVRQHGLADQIAADKYLASRAVAAAKQLGIRIFKMIPHGM